MSDANVPDIRGGPDCRFESDTHTLRCIPGLTVSDLLCINTANAPGRLLVRPDKADQFWPLVMRQGSIKCTAGEFVDDQCLRAHEARYESSFPQIGLFW